MEARHRKGRRNGGVTEARLQSALKDFLAGLVFIGFGLAFAIGAARYDIGSALRMGPGYFPLVLGGILAVLGVVIIVKAFIAGEGAEVGRVPWRAVVVILAALLFFGATIRGLGVVPSVFVTALIAGFAGRRTGVLAPVLIAVGLTVVSVLIFVEGLQLPIPLFGPWIPV